MKNVLLIGEPMALFVAEGTGPLQRVERFTKMLAGAEVNVAIGLRRLGFSCTYVCRVGDDPLGRAIVDRLRAEGIDTTYVRYDPTYPTGIELKGRTDHGDPETSYCRRGSASTRMTPEIIEDIDFSTIDHVHVTGIPAALSPSCRETLFALVRRARKTDTSTTFDPNLRPSLWPSEDVMIEQTNLLASECDTVMPGVSEGELLSGECTPEGIARFYLSGGSSAVVVKEGPQGAYAATGQREMRIPGFPVSHVVDTVGAGDGFAVGLLSGMLEGLDLANAVERGNAIGAMQVMCEGDNEGLPDRAALKAFMAERDADAQRRSSEPRNHRMR